MVYGHWSIHIQIMSCLCKMNRKKNDGIIEYICISVMWPLPIDLLKFENSIGNTHVKRTKMSKHKFEVWFKHTMRKILAKFLCFSLSVLSALSSSSSLFFVPYFFFHLLFPCVPYINLMSLVKNLTGNKFICNPSSIWAVSITYYIHDTDTDNNIHDCLECGKLLNIFILPLSHLNQIFADGNKYFPRQLCIQYTYMQWKINVNLT